MADRLMRRQADERDRATAREIMRGRELPKTTAGVETILAEALADLREEEHLAYNRSLQELTRLDQESWQQKLDHVNAEASAILEAAAGAVDALGTTVGIVEALGRRWPDVERGRQVMVETAAQLEIIKRELAARVQATGRPRLRPALAWFAEALELRLRAKDAEKGFQGWRAATVERLYADLFRHVLNLRGLIELHQANGDKISAKAVDVGALAMMVHDVLGGELTVELKRSAAQEASEQ